VRIFHMPVAEEGAMPEFTIKDVDLMDRKAITDLLGGDMEIVRFHPALDVDGLRIVMVVDGDGIQHGHSINYAASSLYGTDRHGHWIYGDVFLVGEGMVDGEPDFIEFPDVTVEEARALLTRHVLQPPS
jgi:hypothetical protein